MTIRLWAILATLSISWPAGLAGQTMVNLSSVYTLEGIVTDGTTFTSGGLDQGGYAYSSNLLGSSVIFQGIDFSLGPANAPDAVTSATVTLPAGQFSKLYMLATGLNGNQTSQVFTVTYTDGTSSTFTQSLSDWSTPQSYSGEGTAATMAYRDAANGTQNNQTFYLYGYSFTLNAAKTVSSIALPNNSNVVLLAMALTSPAPDFSLTATPGSQSVNAGSAASYTASVGALNGFTGTVALSASGLPTGASASFSPTSVSGSGNSTVSITTTSSVPGGSYAVTITGTSGSLQHSADVTLIVNGGNFTNVNLSSVYTLEGIVTDGTTFTSGGLDQGGYAYSSNLLGSSVIFQGIDFSLGPANAPDAVTSATVTLPAGQFSKLYMLATGLNGNQTSQVFTVTYTDGTSSTFTQSLSDWSTPQSYSGEGTAATMAYRDAANGTQNNQTFYLYGYSFTLNAAKTVSSIALPNNSNVVLLAMALTSPAPDFTLTATPGSQSVNAGSAASYTASVGALNGFTGTVALSASGLPTGASASFSPTSVSGSGNSTVSITTTSSVPGGSYAVTITGTSGSLQHSADVTLIVNGGNFTNVNLSSVYTLEGIVTDGTTFTSGGLDQGGYAYSSNLLGSSVIFQGIDFSLGPANAPDAVTSATVTLPAGQFSKLCMLATGLNGNQTSQVFTVTYTDGTSSTFTQSLSDWSTPQSYSGEGTAATMAYRDAANGTQNNQTFYLYGYSFTLNAAKTVSSIALPNNSNVVLLAMALTSPAPDFTLTATPGSQSVNAGSAASYTASVGALNGFTGTVALSASGLPTGASASFSPTSVSGSGNSTVSITTTSSVPGGSYAVTITGTSGGLQHSADVTLVVTATAASISGLLPTSGPVGTTVTITGSSFGASQGSSIVTFNGTSAATVYSWSASSIEVAVPSGATTGNLVVTVGGVASNGMPFTVGPLGFVTYVYDDLGRLVSVVDQTGAGANYKYDAVGNLLSITRETPVAISSITPTSGPMGTPVTIIGTGFSSQPSQDVVQFNGTAATVTSATASQIVASVPSGAATGPITVTAPSGNATGPTFTVTNAPNAPTIISFNPTIGSSSTLVTISGTNFDPNPLNDTVTIGGAIATVSAASATTITTSVPPQAGTGVISVQTAAGQATSTGNFTVVPNPYSAGSIAFVGRIAIGNSASFNLVPASPVGMVLFNGTSGQHIRLLINTSLANGTVSVYNPDSTIFYTTTLSPNASVLDIPSPLPANGTYTVAVVAGSGLTGSAALFVTIPPTTADFAIFELPNFNVPGYSVYVSAGPGFSTTVTLSLAGLPSGASGSFNPPTVSPTGISILSIVPGTAAGGTYTFTITGTAGATIHNTTATLTVSPLPAAWTDQDIGGVGTPGLGQYEGGVFTIAGAGDGWDTFHYTSQVLNGDGTIIGRLVSESGVAGNASVGLMIRETLATGASFAFVGFSNGGGTTYARDFEFRTSTESAQEGDSPGFSLSLPCWFELVRSGNNFSGYSSSDGSTWVQVGSTQTISMAAMVNIGLAVTSYADPGITTATFDNVLVVNSINTTPDFYLASIPASSVTVARGSVGYPKVFVDPVNGFGGTVTLSVTGLPSGATATFSPASVGTSGSSMLTIATSSTTPAGTYPLTITGVSGSLTHIAPLTLIVSTAIVSLPPPWTNQDIGPGGVGTGSSYSNGVFTLAGMGSLGEEGGTTQIDSFQFAYQPLNGDGTIIAQVTGFGNGFGSNSALPGIMIRETLAPESAYALVSDVIMQYRPSTLGGTTYGGGSSGSVPGWFKLVRSGNAFSGYSSADGSTWVLGGTVTIPMAGTVYIGLAVGDVTSGFAVIDSATFNNVTITNP